MTFSSGFGSEKLRRMAALSLVMASAVSWAQSDGPAAKPAAPIERMTAQEMVERLSVPNTRSLRNLAPRLDLSVQFDFDSAKLRPASHELLNNLVRALQSDALKELRVRVEGHTDGVGALAYNEALSQRRAESVVGYLIEAGVDRQRLEAQGLGSSQPLYPEDPRAPGNRRVRVTPVRP